MARGKPTMVYDEERFHVNTAFLKRGGEHFEVVIDPDKAVAFRASKGAGEVRECLHAERVFADAKRGQHAKEAQLRELFGTDDSLAIARIILLEGELQLTAAHRAKLREQKRNDILTRIRTYAVDPRTGLPHPQQRIELAFEEAKVRLDDSKSVEEQLQTVVRQLQPVLPIRLEMVTLQLHIPAPYGQKLYGEIQRAGTLRKAEWLADGALLAFLELPAGLQTDLYEELGKRTHGAAEIKRIEERGL